MITTLSMLCFNIFFFNFSLYLCGDGCAAGRETVAWISDHNTNICTASHPCELWNAPSSEEEFFSQIFSKISIITWCAAPTGGCWRRTWDIADTDEASPRVCLRYLLCQAALPSLSSNTKQNKISHEKKTCVLFSVDGQDLCFMLKTPSEKSPGHKISSEYGEAGCSKYSLTRGPRLTLV